MKDEYYTTCGQHPEDAIFKAKTFINELQQVQESYFNKLVQDLRLTKNGEDWLFDYVYNTPDEEGYDGFEHYLQDYKQKYDNFVKPQDIMIDSCYNPGETLLSTDFGEFSPMFHMSSYEPELETAFPSPYNDSEPFSLGLETLTFKHAQDDKITNKN
jgi:hypothetical protein